MALLLKLGLPALEATRWLGIAFAAGSVFLAARAVRALTGGWGPLAVGVAALVAGNSALALWSGGGLETGLFVFLVTLAWERGTAPGISAAGRRLAPALFAAATLTRPDAPLFFGVWFAARLVDTLIFPGPLRDPRGARGLLVDLAIFSTPVLLFLLWKTAYYGNLLPNTYYAKAGVSPAYFTRGLEYAGAFLRAYGAAGLVPALGLVPLFLGKHRRWAGTTLLLILVYGFYVLGIGGDVLPAHRFWLPIVPMGAALVGAGTLEAIRLIWRQKPGRSGSPAMAAGAVLALMSTVVFFLNREEIDERRRAHIGSVEKLRGIALWLKRELAPDEPIAATAIGAIAYYSDRPVIDMLGLTDPEIARRPEILDGLVDTWKEKRYNAASVLRRRPGAIVFSTGLRPSSSSEKALFLYEDFHRSYYLHTFRLDPRQTWVESVYRLRPDASPVPETMIPVHEREFIEHFAAGMLAQAGNRELPRAAESFEMAVRTGPAFFTMGHGWWASMLHQIGDPRGPGLLRRTIALDSLQVIPLARLAFHHVLQDEIEPAQRLYAKLREVSPDDPELWKGIAEIARRRGDYAQARAAIVHSLEAWSTNPAATEILARICVETGDLDGAERAFRALSRLHPGSELARRGLEMVARAQAENRSGIPDPGR
jgi:tetratricopeptide (TPR) repeat protein